MAYEAENIHSFICSLFFFLFPLATDCPERFTTGVGFVMRQLFSAGILYVGSRIKGPVGTSWWNCESRFVL